MCNLVQPEAHSVGLQGWAVGACMHVNQQEPLPLGVTQKWLLHSLATRGCR